MSISTETSNPTGDRNFPGKHPFDWHAGSDEPGGRGRHL